MHENVFVGAHCQQNLRLFYEIFLRVKFNCATLFMGFTQWYSSEIENRKILKHLI